MKVIPRSFARQCPVFVRQILICLSLGFPQPASAAEAMDHPSLLFHAPFDNSLSARTAAGDPDPLTVRGEAEAEATLVPSGHRGGCLFIDHDALLTYEAAGNLFAERGTAALWLKLGEPPGRTSFNILEITYAQHSSWDYDFGAIAWTGQSLIAYFIDRNRERRVITAADRFAPREGVWTHLALTWDELEGIRLYVDGREAGVIPGPVHLAANLDQIGLFPFNMSPHTGAWGSDRRAYIDDFMVFSTALDQADVARLMAGEAPAEMDGPKSVTEPEMMKHRQDRYGWGSSGGGDLPEVTGFTRIRTVQLPRGIDVKKFYWHASDGKRETTWPGWGYRFMGRKIRFPIAGEPFNLISVRGNIEGSFSLKQGGQSRSVLDRSEVKSERTYQHFPKTEADSLIVDRSGGTLGEVQLFLVDDYRGDWSERIGYSLEPGEADDSPTATAISDRYPAGERGCLWGGAIGEPAVKPAREGRRDRPSIMPTVQVIIPGGNRDRYLGAVRIGLAGVTSRLSGDDKLTLNLILHDPVYPLRELVNIDIAVGPDSKADLLLDIRDLPLAAGTPLWLTVIGSHPDFGPEWLAGARVELCLVKPETARREFVPDRENQMLDSFYTLIEPRRWMRVGREFPDYESLRRRVKMIDELCLYLDDMAHFAPDNEIAGHYRRQVYRAPDTRPYTPPQSPSPEVPLWAFQQNLIVKKLQGIGNWWIENRGASTGELGSGLGDDSDLIQNWPGLALMDGPAETIQGSVRKIMNVCYEWGLVTDGLNRRRTDALHAYEEGINTPPLALLLDYGDPLVVERLMETARHYERLTGINPAGHRHFRSWMVSATDIVEEGIHARQDIWSPLMFHSGLYLAWYNGHQPTIKVMSEFADALLDHWKNDTYPDLALGIMFASDEVIRRDTPRTDIPHILWGLYDLTGDKKYLWLLRESLKHQDWNAAVGLNANWLNDLEGEVEIDSLLAYAGRLEGRSRWLAGQTAWELTGELKYLEDYQAELLKELEQNMFLYTEAHHYTDRVWVPSDATQRARLGGVVHRRNCLYPGHAVSWENTGGELAALVLESGRDRLKCLLFNLSAEERTVTARLWRLEPGSYRVKLGPDKDRDRAMDEAVHSDRKGLRRAEAVELVLPGRQQAVLEITQIKKTTPLHQLPDPAIGEADLNFDRERGTLTVRVHNLGMVPTGAFTVRLSDSDGNIIEERRIKNIEAPADLIPRVEEIVFTGVTQRAGLRVEIDPEKRLEEITELNNSLLCSQ